jgi:hypothetical protein
MICFARAILVLLFIPAAVVAGNAAVVEHPLAGEAMGRLERDGTIQLGVFEGDVWRSLLRVSWPNSWSGRNEASAPITAAASGGLKAWLDRPDGGLGDPVTGRLENAILERCCGGFRTGPASSDLMGLWVQDIDGRTRCLGTHHWEHPLLCGLIIAVYSQDAGPMIEDLRLSLSMPGYWVSASEACPPPPGTPDMPAFLAYLADPRPGAAPLWVGAVLLDGHPRRQPNTGIHIDRADLHVPFADTHQQLALTVGPTRLQVQERLAAAVDFQQGGTDPESGNLVRWLLPAAQDGLLPERMPRVFFHQGSRDRFSLVFQVDEGQPRRFDPDLFRLDGQDLGPAQRLSWIDDSGRRTAIEWSGGSVLRGGPCRPYENLGAHGAGTLEILFPGPAPFGLYESHESFELDSVFMDGRRWTHALDLNARQPQGLLQENARAAGENRQPQLLPSLLVSSPNPFHTWTRVNFRVPGTFGEAFSAEEDRVQDFDPNQRMPYAGGDAHVRVTIYNLEGRELTTLFAGLAGEGVYEATWDGRDREGRAQASGTYVCRLQIERWSVTRRLIYIR